MNTLEGTWKRVEESGGERRRAEESGGRSEG